MGEAQGAHGFRHIVHAMAQHPTCGQQCRGHLGGARPLPVAKIQQPAEQRLVGKPHQHGATQRVEALYLAQYLEIVFRQLAEPYAGLSILSLKVFHMEEQAERADAAPDHRERCAAKLAVLREQRADLAQAVLDLTEEFLEGRKQPKAYYQFKMYNDPSLNPELYNNVKG